MARCVSSKKATAVLLLVACVIAAAAPHHAVATSSAVCSAYATYFPYVKTATACIMKNMCYTRTYCCASENHTDLSLCLDITTFKCNLTSACAAHSGDSSWYPFTSDSGLSLSCCRDGYTTTPAPAVPNFDVSESADLVNSSTIGPLPVRTCDEDSTKGCAVTNGFPSLVRAFCKDAIPSTYTDAYLVQSASNMCCKYAAAPSRTTQWNSIVGTVKCGMGLLDLPHVGEYHCSLSGRAAVVCCNGRITSTEPSSNSSVSSSRLGDNYTYLSNTCLYVPRGGDGAVFSRPIAVTLVALAAAIVMSALQ